MVSQQQIQDAAQIIRKGGLVAFPTETVYGLGANALNPDAVAKIFIEKERPSFDPLIVHIASVDNLSLLVEPLDKRVFNLADKFWPGPLTIVLPKSKIVPDIVTAGLNTVGIRMPNNSVALDLIRYSKSPIAAPSANKFGKLSPTTAEHVKKQMPLISCILDGGQTNIGIESTVISINAKGFDILRHGIITKEEIEKVLPYSKQTSVESNLFPSPGLLKSHYTPNKPLYFLNEISSKINTNNAGILSFSGVRTSEFKIVESLTHSLNLREAAVNLFAAMHKLEEADIEFIVVEPVSESGIGIAIMDRLKKASFKTINNHEN